MFVLAIKKIYENKSRTTLTVAGIAVAIFILIIGVYYLYLGNEVSKEQLSATTKEQRIIYKEVDIDNTTYSEDNGNMVGNSTPMNMAYVDKMESLDYVSNVVYGKELDESLYIDFEDYKFEIDMPYAVSTEYDTFSDALCEVSNVNKPVLQGRDFNNSDQKAALINEITLKYMQVQPEDIIGKKITVSNGSGKSCTVTIVGVYAYELSSYYSFDIDEIGTYIPSDEYDFYGMDMIFSDDVVEELKNDREIPVTIKVSVDDIHNIETLISEIRENSSYDYISDYELYYASIRKSVSYSRLILLIGIMVTMIAILLILCTVMLNISDQKKTIRLYSFLGMKDSKISTYFLYQGLCFCVTGSLIGGAIGYAVTLIIGSRFAGQYEEIIDKTIFVMPIHYVLWLICIILAICIAIGFVGKFFILVSSILRGKS